jgi:hypothetical protein
LTPITVGGMILLAERGQMGAGVDHIAGLVTTILGALGAFLTAWGAFERGRRPRGPSARVPKVRRFVSGSAMLGLLVGISLVALPLGVFLLLTRGQPAADVRISSPPFGARVPPSTEVIGRSAHLGSRDVWVFVQSHSAPQLYPQPGPAAVVAEGSWSARAYFRYGDPRDTQFEIYAVLATRRASREIARYYEQREARSGSARFFTLPEGAEIKDRITVTLASASALAGCSHSPAHTASLAGEADITTLSSGDAVSDEVDPLEGTYRALAPATRLWLIVYSPVSQRFYPTAARPDEPTVLSDGRFRGAAFFGGQPGEYYEVAAVLATPEASNALSRTLERWQRANDYVGLTAAELPPGLDEKDCVPVVRRS